VLLMLMLMHWLLLWWPGFTPRRRGVSPARHGRMRGILRRGRRGMRLTDLVSLIRLLPLIAHLGLLRMLLLDVLVLPIRRLL